MRFVKENSKDRIYGLDILRSIAILNVVGVHSALLINNKSISFLIYTIFFFDGVGIFFVLSGFLIGKIIIKSFIHHKIAVYTFKSFWYRRWIRTLPNYYLILTILIVWHFYDNSNFHFSYLPRYLVFAQNLERPMPTFFGESWSLGVEEWFYLLYPIILFLIIKLIKDKKKGVLISILSIIIFSNLSRFLFYNFQNNITLDIWLNLFRNVTINRLDNISIGVLAAYTYIYHRNFWEAKSKILLKISILLLIVLFFGFIYVNLYSFDFFYCLIYFNLLPLPTLFALPFLTSIKTGNGFIYKALTFISLISYSIYLINYSLVEWKILPEIMSHLQFLPENVFLGFRYLLFWLMTFFLSFILFKYFEQPILNLRDRKLNIKQK